jgi:lactate permease
MDLPIRNRSPKQPNKSSLRRDKQMHFILAFIPIAIILLLMVGFRWGAARAGGAGYLCALAIAVFFFGAGLDLLAFAHTKALLLSLDVLYIIWAAFLLYRVADEAGAIRTIGLALPHLTSDRGMQAIIIGWVFASFLQGVGGFGVPVAVIAPLLVGLGFTPLAAVIIPSIGHAWAVTFGSLASSYQALIAATGVPGEVMAHETGLFLGLSGMLGGAMVVHMVGGWAGVRRLIFPVVVLGVIMGAAQYILSVSRLWNLGALGGSLAALAVIFPLAKRFQGERLQQQRLVVRDVIIALSGYACLILITLGVQLIPPVHAFFSQVVIEVPFPELETALGHVTPAGLGRRIPLFSHAGALLTYASIAAYLIYRKAGRYQLGAIRRIANGTLKRVMSSSVSIASMVSMAVIMEHAGMTEILARSLAESVGAGFPLVAPWIGAMGAFMTGSNTNSNVVFGLLQLRTAELLGFYTPLILAAQTAGAGLASVIAPTKIVVGASTAGMAGREGEVMRKLLVYTSLMVAFISILTLVGILIHNNF